MSGDGRPSIAIVMPAFNEHARIEQTLRAVASYQTTTGQRLPLLVCDDGSSDDTGALAGRLAHELGLDCRVLRLPHRGKALTVREGMLEAAVAYQVDYLLMLDADNEISIDQLDGVDWQPERSTIYIARRVSEVGASRAVRPTLLRRSMSTGMRLLARVLLGLPYPDTQCGFKLFPRSLVPALFGQQRTASWVFDAEILTIAHRISHLQVREVPVVWQPRGVSHVRALSAVTSALSVLGVASRKARRTYRAVHVDRRP